MLTTPTKEHQKSDGVTQELALQIIRDWKGSGNLRAEFSGNFKRYISFMLASAAGKVRFCGKA